MLWRSRATLERQCRLNTKHTFLKIKNKTTPKGGHYQNPTATNQVLLCLAEGLELCAHQAEHLFSPQATPNSRNSEAASTPTLQEARGKLGCGAVKQWSIAGTEKEMSCQAIGQQPLDQY